MATLKRPSFGQSAKLGTLYDARRDTFLAESLVDGGFTQDLITEISLEQSTSTVSNEASLKVKFAKLGLSNELVASFLAGMIEPQGAYKYLTRRKDATPAIYRVLDYVITTKQESLSFGNPSLADSLDLTSLSERHATHFVTGITWGGRTIVVASQRLSPGADAAKQEVEMDEAFQEFDDVQSSPPSYRDPFEDQAEVRPTINIYSDFSNPDDDAPESLHQAFRRTRGLRERIESSLDRKGKPLIYTLMPISFLVTFGAAIPDEILVGQLSSECTEEYVTTLDELVMAQQSVTAYHENLKLHSSIVRAEHLIEVQDKLAYVQKYEARFRADFARLVIEVRGGRASASKLWQTINEFLAGDAAPKKLLTVTEEYVDKLEFISIAVDLGAEYESVACSPTDFVRNFISKRGTSYVFFFNNEVITSDEKWEEHVDLLRGLLNERPKMSSIILADCAFDASITRALISAYVNGELKIKDLLTDRKLLADKHMIKFMANEVQKTEHLPSQRKAVVLPCPDPNCNGYARCEWTCSTCCVAMEYSPTDRKMYCECGKIPAEVARFNCQRAQHGLEYARFNPSMLRKLLEKLPPPPEINILILGETGVGKSTFINAFVNYLTFSTLDEALEATRLNMIIPCSFTTNTTDPRTGRLLPKVVKVGTDANENDRTGASATQQATVYPIYIGGTLVRLIDTPGIGDTRGHEQDKQNLANILSVLRNYSELHGILFLLKPNMPRLHVMFRFCVKELLSSLHRSAAGNIAFGFTNTRGANYTPGDTFAPLEQLLSDYDDVMPGLFDYNVYCFDSESFRYLAAQKQGISLGSKEDYRRSWEQSTGQADRLMAYFKMLKPHNVQETLSLNETRHLIAQLTQPMQQISQAITDTIAKSEQQVRDLADTKLVGKDLMARLQVTKSIVKATQLSRPKTVCSHETCVTPVQDAIIGNVLLRKSLCHDPCYLTEVPVAVRGTEKLAGCAAFASSGGKTCAHCHHKWSDHEHIMVEYTATSQTTTDPGVQAALNNNSSLVTVKEAQIRALQNQVSELKNEHRFIQEAAAKFSIYMKNHSITHYNDATIEYMEQLIRDEKSKLRAGETRDRLERLERDKAQYETYVTAMESGKLSLGRHKSAAADLDERGVALLVQQMYNLKHYGQQLKEISKVVGNAYAANFRERPYRIQGKRAWVDGSTGGKNGHGEQGPVLWIPKRQNFNRQNTLLEQDLEISGDGHFDELDQTRGDVGIKSFTSRVKGDSHNRNPFYHDEQYENDPGQPLSHDYPPSQWLSPVAEQQSLPVRSIADWSDGVASQYSRSHSQYINKRLATSVAARALSVRSPPASTYSGPPPYGTNEYTQCDIRGNVNNYSDGYAAMPTFRNAAQKRSKWSSLKDKLRKHGGRMG